MRVFVLIVRVLLTLLGLSTGAVKLAHMPEEMAIFRQAGFPDAATVAFGLVQIVATLATLHPKTRKPGAAALAVTFVVATGVLFANGMVAFGVFSLLFIAMAGLVYARG